MSWLTDGFSMLAISQLIIVIVFLGRALRTLEGKLSITLALSLMCIVLRQHSLLVGLDPLNHFLLLPALASPFLIYLLTHAVFVDQEAIRPFSWILAAYYILARFTGTSSLFGDIELGVAFAFIVFVLPQTVMLYFTSNSVYIVSRGFKPDLIEKRRKHRVIFGLAVSLFLLVLVSRGFMSFADPYLENLIPIKLDPLPGYVITITIFFLALGFNIVTLVPVGISSVVPTGAEKNLTSQEASEDISQFSPKTQRIITKINGLMNDERYYAKHNMGVSELSQAIGCPIHKLREIINKEMGFKNFNQFLNQYRLREATERLRNSELPVSSIALDVGYSSLSTFNSAFKYYYHMTPTQFRNTN